MENSLLRKSVSRMTANKLCGAISANSTILKISTNLLNRIWRKANPRSQNISKITFQSPTTQGIDELQSSDLWSVKEGPSGLSRRESVAVCVTFRDRDNFDQRHHMIRRVIRTRLSEKSLLKQLNGWRKLGAKLDGDDTPTEREPFSLESFLLRLHKWIVVDDQVRFSSHFIFPFVKQDSSGLGCHRLS